VWRDSDKVTGDAPSMTITQSGALLTVKSSDGTSYTARIGGPFVPVEGSNIPTTVAVSKAGPRVLVLRFKHGSKLSERDTWTFKADGKTVDGVFASIASGRTTRGAAIKQ
jgi:hypothetical protein